MAVKISESGAYDVSDDVTPVGNASADAAYEQLRRDYERFFDRSVFSSESNAQEIRNWLDEIAGDEQKIREARENFRQYTVPLLEKENRLYERFKKDLGDALRERAISRDSYDEWLEWVHSDNVDAEEKERSLTGARGSEEDFPAYLSTRRELAKKRSELLGDSRLGEVTDSELKSKIELVREDRKFFEELSVNERFSTISEIIAKLKVSVGGEFPREWVAEAERKLKDATKLPQPALHRDKVGGWLEKIFVEWPKRGEKPDEIRKFIFGGGLDGYIRQWRSLAIQFWRTREDPALKGVNPGFVNTKGFLAMSTEGRREYVERTMPQTIARAKALRSQAEQLVSSAWGAGALDAAGKKRWMEKYVFNGSFSLDELQSIISGNMSERIERKVDVAQRFDTASNGTKKIKGIRGMSIPSKSAFLTMKFPLQEAIVLEMENRLKDIEKNKPGFLRIRHLMDRKDWDGAEELIVRAREMGPLSFEDELQLYSMGNYIALHRDDERSIAKASADIVDPTLPESAQINQLIAHCSPALQPFYRRICQSGSEVAFALGWTMYNRDWCWQNGYLDAERERHAIDTGQLQALRHMRRKTDDVVSETIKGRTGDEEYIELSRSSATNVCVDISDAGALAAFEQEMNGKKDDDRALYWTNTLFHRGGTPMSLDQQKRETRYVYRMGKLLESLEERGEWYLYSTITTP